MEIVKKLRIFHPEYNYIFNTIRECHTESHLKGRARSVLVMAESGCGKTAVSLSYLEKYYQEHVKRKVDENGKEKVVTTKNIVWVRLKSPTFSVSALLSTLLAGVDDLVPDFGANHVKYTRLIRRLLERDVELIMIDEFQNIVDRDKKKTLLVVSDVIKSIINDTNIPFALFGLHDCIDIMNVNDQLANRFQRREYLTRFSYDTKNDQEVFEKLLFNIDKRLPFDETSNLSSNLCEKLFVASDGLMLKLMTLIEDASKFAIEEKHSHITMDDFAKAFEINGFINEKPERNGSKKIRDKWDNPFK